MKNVKKGDWKITIILGIISLIIVLVIFLPGLIESKNELANLKR